MKYLKIISKDGVVLLRLMLPLGLDGLTRAEWKLPVPIYNPISLIVIEEEEE